MNIYQRTEDVLEIQEGPSTAVRGKAACDLMIDNKLPFITLLSMIKYFFKSVGIRVNSKMHKALFTFFFNTFQGLPLQQDHVQQMGITM